MDSNTGDTADLDTKVRRLQAFLNVSRLMNAETDRARLVHRINDEVRVYLEADRFTVFFHDAESDDLYSYIASGLEPGEIRIASDHGIAGHVFQTGETIRVERAYDDPRFDPEVDRRTGYHTRNMLAMPIANRRGKRIGAVQALNKHDGNEAFSDEDVEFLAELVEQISDLLDLLLRKEELARQQAEMREAMSQLKVYEYLIGETTAAKVAMRWMRRLHLWIGVIGTIAILAMTVSGIFAAHDKMAWWKFQYNLHTGKLVFGKMAFLYTDIVGAALVVITVTGIALWGYPRLAKWMRHRVEMRAARRQRHSDIDA